MDLLIKPENINDAPYSINREVDFKFEENEQFIQLRQELLYGTPTSFMISGYRGSGKTSFIRGIEETLNTEENKRKLFVSLNFPKQESYSIMLRKIIREIYLTLSKTSDFQEVKKNHKEKVLTLEMLFDRTFKDVTQIHTNISQKDIIKTFQTEFNLKKMLGSIILVVLSFLGFTIDVTEWIGIMQFIIFIGSILVISIESLKLVHERTYKSSEFEEISRRTLYDDEIAEYQLIETMKNLNEMGYKIVFIIDELDKIEEIEEVESLIRELKNLVLSGLANFIFISGQSLYYKLENSYIDDDSLIASTFSKTIHIPLLSIEQLENIFKEILVDGDQDFDNGLVNNYIKAKILQSNRLPRRFLNLLRQDVKWKDKKAYIHIVEDQATSYETDKKILEIIEKIVLKDIYPKKYNAAINDFLITQLHIWIRKVKLKSNSTFSIDHIYNIESDYRNTHPIQYFASLNPLINKLLNELTDNQFLIKDSEVEEDEEVETYRWNPDVDFESPSEFNSLSDEWERDSQFLKRFLEFETYLRDSYSWIANNNDQVINKNAFKNYQVETFKNLIRIFVDIGVLPSNWIADSKINELRIMRNEIVHKSKRQSITDSKLKNLQGILDRIERDFFFYLTLYFIKKTLKTYKIDEKYQSPDDIGYDILALNEKSNKSDIYFEIKSYSYINGSRLEALIKNIKYNLAEYDLNNFKRNQYVLVIFLRQPVKRVTIENFTNSVLEKNYSDFGDRITVIYLTANNLNQDLHSLSQHLAVLR